MRADISQEEQACAIADETVRVFGKVDILVNNAAVFVLKGIDASVEDWRRSLGVNVIGTSRVTKYAIEPMKKGGGRNHCQFGLHLELGGAGKPHHLQRHERPRFCK